MITKISRMFKPIQKMIILRMIAVCQGRIAFKTHQIERDKVKLTENGKKPNLNFLQNRDMVEREGRILFNERQLEKDRVDLEILKEKLRRLM